MYYLNCKNAASELWPLVNTMNLYWKIWKMLRLCTLPNYLNHYKTERCTKSRPGIATSCTFFNAWKLVKMFWSFTSRKWWINFDADFNDKVRTQSTSHDGPSEAGDCSHISWFMQAHGVIYKWFLQFLPPSPPGWRGIVVTVRVGGQPGGLLPDLRNPYLCNRLTYFLRSKFCGIILVRSCHCRVHLPICPMWAYPWAKNLLNLPQMGADFAECISLKPLDDLPHFKFHWFV